MRMGWPCRRAGWDGHAGAPDLFVMLRGRHFWIECKAPGESPRAIQLREHRAMRETGGCLVYVADCPESAEEILKNG